ncbi:MAG: PEP-CTERM sorting domain-containing protein [Armatimonadetes bacterium]|nr:PEP-CTERM sorting domain-containing protein [Armatimonadota bacterium]
MKLNIKYALVSLGLGLTVSSHAIVTFGGSDAYGVQTSVSLLTFNLNIGAVPTASGTAPPPYNDTDQVLSLNVSGGALGSLSTGIMTVNASSDVDGTAGSRFAMADAEVNGLNLVLVPGTGSPDLLNLTADQVTSDSMVSGDFGSLVGVGNTVLTNTVLTILGTGVSINSNPAPNTVVFNSLGITITLNEQFASGDGISSRGQTTNAIHIGLVDVVGGGGLVNGDIVIAHSAANLEAVVPEPTSIIGAVVGLAWLAARRRRR